MAFVPKISAFCVWFLFKDSVSHLEQLLSKRWKQHTKKGHSEKKTWGETMPLQKSEKKIFEFILCIFL